MAPPADDLSEIPGLIKQIREKAAERSTICIGEQNGMMAFNALVDLAYREYEDRNELMMFLRSIYGIICGQHFPSFPMELQDAFKNGMRKLTRSHPEEMLGTEEAARLRERNSKDAEDKPGTASTCKHRRQEPK